MTAEEENNDRLMRLVQLASSSDTVASRPTPEALASCLQGTATEEEKAQVRRALDQSSSFRREFLSLIKDLEAVESGQAEEPVEVPIQVPEDIRREVLKEYRSDPVPAPSLWERLRESIVVRVYVPVAAAAAILLVVIQSLIPPSAQEWELVRSEVEPAELISMETRSASELTFATAEQAALAGFAQMLEFGDGRFHFKPADSLQMVPAGPTREITLTLTDRDGDATVTYVAQIPKSMNPKRDELTAWMLTLPDRRVFRANITALSPALIAPEASVLRIVLVAVFEGPSGYQFDPFQLNRTRNSAPGTAKQGTGG